MTEHDATVRRLRERNDPNRGRPSWLNWHLNVHQSGADFAVVAMVEADSLGNRTTNTRLYVARIGIVDEVGRYLPTAVILQRAVDRL
jgi:hypothetical protein